MILFILIIFNNVKQHHFVYYLTFSRQVLRQTRHSRSNLGALRSPFALNAKLFWTLAVKHKL